MLDPKLLHKYQVRALNRVIKKPNVGLFMEMGLGKTITVLSAIQYLKFEQLLINKVLIIAPLRVARMVWQQEAEKWSHTKDLRFSKILGKEKERIAALSVKADIYITNIDNIAWLIAHLGENWPFDMVVIDESSKIKNPASRRFKALKIIRPLVDRVVLLTGTPRPQSISDLWSQIFMLDGGERLGQSITSFRQMYLTGHEVYGAPRGVKKYDVDPYNEDRIYSKIEDICVSMQTKDYLELPERVNTDIRIPITDKVQEAYNTFERDKILELIAALDGDPTKITALNAAGLSTKLRQYTSGAIYDENKTVHIVHDLKIEALHEIMEDADGDPVLVFYAFKSNRDRLIQQFKKYKPRHLNKDIDFEDWNKGKIKMGIGHLASMGHGLNLQECPAKDRINIVFYDLNWDLDLVLQGITRILRQGLKSKVFVYRLILDQTIDDRIIQSNEDKNEGQKNLMSFISEKIQMYKNNNHRS